MNAGIRILLIEDDAEYARLMKVHIERAIAGGESYTMQSAASLAEGLERLGRRKFDVVLLDLMLTDSEGLDTLAELRRRAPDIPVVVLTNLDPVAADLKAIQGGAQDFLIKSEVDGRQLRRAIGYTLERSRIFGQMEALVRAAPDGVVIIDQAGIVRYANPAALGLFNQPAEKLEGRPFAHPLPANMPSFLDLPGPGGGLSVELRRAPIEWKGAKAQMVTLRDTTDLTRLEQARAEVQERLRMDRLKDKLLNTVSHELRTPLTIISVAVNATAQLLAGPLTKEQENLLASAQRNIARLTRILDNFLDLSRLESGRAKVDLQTLKFEELVREVTEDIRLTYKNKNISLFVNFPPNLPPIRADRDMLTQALTNLLDNALRYAKSRVQVRIRQAGSELVLSVVDDGQGFPPQSPPEALFDKFVQLQRPKGGEGYKGTGLGLAICREILTLNRGRIWANNVAGWGAGFYFAVPVAAPAATLPAGDDNDESQG